MAMDFSKTGSAKTAKKRLEQAVLSNTKGRVVDIPVGKLKESPFNKDMPLGNIEELADSIKRDGLQEACLVYSLDGGMYEIYAGHRRFHAIKSLKWDSVPCIVKPYPEDPETRFRDHLVNNAERRDNNFRYWLAEIKAAREVLMNEKKWTKRDLVLAMVDLLDKHISEPQIYRYEAVEKMPDEMIMLGDLGYSAYTLCQAFKLDADRQKELGLLVADITNKNGEIISQKEFAAYVDKMADGEEVKPVPKKVGYEAKLQTLETKIVKGFGTPKTNEEKQQALTYIVRMRALLDNVEEQIRGN